MAVITITITESPIQKVAGIPTSVELSTNVPATIFYTLDGTEPTIASAVAVGPIELPGNDNTVTLKAFATDGAVTSATVTEVYGTSTVPCRQPHDKVTEIDVNGCNKATYPFGSAPPNPDVVGIYGNTGGITVDDPEVPGIPDGYDGTGTGTPAGETDEPLQSYDNIYSETDSIGERGEGIGTLPASATIIEEPPDSPPEFSNTASPTFDPRALVIFQDGSQEPYDTDVAAIMRPYFNLQDQEIVRDGALLQTAPEGLPPSGSALKSQWNPVDNKITYYYFDSTVNRWIISREPYDPAQNPTTNLSGMVFSSRQPSGAGFVFKWVPFKYRRLI